jgi:probable phosphoglycerate mutase
VSRKLIVEADGGSRGNPGPAGYGAVVVDAETGEVLAEVAESIGRATNNVAEYRGLVAGLRAAAQLSPGAAVEVRMDSKLVVEQMSGRWQIKHADMKPLAQAARDAARALGPVTYQWVPRARNQRADRLANDAMDGSQRRLKPRPPAVSPAASPRGSVESAATGPAAAAAPAAPAARRVRESPRSGLASGWAPPRQKPTTTLLLRHGETPLSAERRFAGTGDIPLTEAGRRQAVAAAARLAGGGIDLIVTSPLQRARRTADEVARATGAPLRVEPGIAETDFGDWEGLTFGEAWQRWPAEVDAWLDDPEVAPPGGESFAAVDRRVRAVLGSLLAGHEGKTLLLVSHVTPIKTLLRHALLAPAAALYRMHLDVGCLCEIAWYADGPAVVHSLNDTGHLKAVRAQ